MSAVKLRPGISLCFKEGCISVGKDVIRALGEPRYISILKNDEKKTLLIIPCGEYDPLSFKVPEDLLVNTNKKFRIYSLQFVEDIRVRYGFTNINLIRLSGVYDSTMRSVVFELGIREA